MDSSADSTPKKTKGKLTAERIMNAAEVLFASKGYKGTSLREIAQAAHIQQPGIYKHFDSKRDLYSSVLDRGLSPMIEAMRKRTTNSDSASGYAALWEKITDLLAEHPSMASLFQQALHAGGDDDNLLIHDWLQRLFTQGQNTITALGVDENMEPEEQAIHLIATFNLVTGYFLSQQIYDTLATGKLTDADNIARQKKLMRRIATALQDT